MLEHYLQKKWQWDIVIMRWIVFSISRMNVPAITSVSPHPTCSYMYWKYEKCNYTYNKKHIRYSIWSCTTTLNFFLILVPPIFKCAVTFTPCLFQFIFVRFSFPVIIPRKQMHQTGLNTQKKTKKMNVNAKFGLIPELTRHLLVLDII